jgi:hypothetical protein
LAHRWTQGPANILIFTNGSRQFANTSQRHNPPFEFIDFGLKGAESEIYSIGDIGMPDKLAHLPNDDNWMAINQGMRYKITLD